jgi:hypothetical protein
MRVTETFQQGVGALQSQLAAASGSREEERERRAIRGR